MQSFAENRGLVFWKTTPRLFPNLVCLVTAAPRSTPATVRALSICHVDAISPYLFFIYFSFAAAKHIKGSSFEGRK